MRPCSFCGETVKKEARQCVHCRRNISITAGLSRALSEKEAYALFRSWNRLTYDHANLTRWVDYGAAKRQLTKSPTTLAKNLSFAQWEDFERRFNDLPLTQECEELAVELEQAPPTNTQRLLWTSYLFIGLTALGVSLHLLWQNTSEPTESPRPTQSISIQIPETDPTEKPAPLLPKASALDTRQLMEHALDSTVFIRDAGSLGSGFFISTDGHILTNYHVVQNMRSPRVYFRSGEEYPAQILRTDPDKDLALLTINQQVDHTFKLADASLLHPGQPVITIGNPSGLGFTVTQGIVSYVGRPIDGLLYIQTDSAINPGNSGGPMLNSDFEVIGINTLTAKEEKGISFAVPSNYAFHGISSGIGEYPRAAMEFPVLENNSSRPQIAGREQPPRSAARNPYWQEIQNLQQERTRRIERLQAEGQALVSEADDLQEKIPQTNLIRQRDQHQARLTQIQQHLDTLNRQITQEQIRYLRRLVSVLQRQQGDSAFRDNQAKIQEQIRNAEAERRQLETQL